MFVLDRLDPQEVGGGRYPGTIHQQVIELLLDYAREQAVSYYVTPVIGCPPRDPYTLYNEQVIPLPKTPEIVACSARVHAEIHAVQPRVVVACGQAAARSLLPTKTPDVLSSAGSVVEAYVRGEHVAYPVPVVLTMSLHDLAKVEPDGTPGPWDDTYRHFLTALDLVDQLKRMETQDE